MIKVGVVLPYYQREPGLLLKALRSALDQDLPDDVELVMVVVNDESPCPPDADLAALGPTGRHRLILLNRENGGPGAARNTGLDHLAVDPVDFVAFLDTDDTWSRDHVGTALACLGDDCDFFLSNHEREGSNYFDQHPVVGGWLNGGEESPLQKVADGLSFRIKTGIKLETFLQEYLAQTSTVVYRHDRLGHVRFNPLLRVAGEDYLFWLFLADGARQVCLSTKVGAICGSGVNIFHATLSWDHPNAPARFGNQLMLWRYVDSQFTLTPAEREIVRAKIDDFERGFSYIWLRTLLKSGKANTALLRTLREQSGWNLWHVPRSVVSVARRRMAREPMFSEY